MPDIKIKNKSKDNNAEEKNTEDESIFEPVPMKYVMYMITTSKRAEPEPETETDTETDDKK